MPSAGPGGEGKSEFGRGEAIRALGVWATANELPVLLRAFRDGGLREGAAKGIRTVGPAAEKEVIGLLNEPDVGVRQEAIAILAEIGTRQCVPALQAVMASNDAGTRDRARDAIAAIQARAKS